MRKFNNMYYLEKTIDFCQELEELYKCFTESSDDFFIDHVYKASTFININYIAISVNRLSENFKQAHNIIPWSEIRDLSYIFIHHHEELSKEFVQSIVTNMMPTLKQFCQEQLEILVHQ